MLVKKAKEYHRNDQLIIFHFDPISYPVDNVPQPAGVVLAITKFDSNLSQGWQLLVINVKGSSTVLLFPPWPNVHPISKTQLEASVDDMI